MEDYRIVYDIRFWKKTSTLTDYVSLSVPPILEDIDIALVDEGVDLVKFIRDFTKNSDRVELLKEDWLIEIPDEIKIGETVKVLNISNNYDEHTTSGIRTHYDREMITVAKRLVLKGKEQELLTEKEQEADTEIKPPYVYTLTLVQHHQMYEEQSNPVVNSVSLDAFSSMNKVKDFVGDLLDSTLPQVDYKVELLVLDDSYISRCVYGPMIDAGERKTIVRGAQAIKDRYGFETGYRKEHIELRKLKLY